MIVKVNLRHLPRHTRRAVRELTRELRLSNGAHVTELEAKANAVLRTAFILGGRTELSLRRAQLRNWLGDEARWQSARLSSYLYSNDAAAACQELEAEEARGTLTPLLAATYVTALAADGRIEEAIDRAPQVWPQLPPRSARHRRPGGDVFSLLLASGKHALLRRHRPTSPRFRSRLQVASGLGAPHQTGLPTFCINLEDAPQRWRRVELLLGPGVDLARQRGVAGRTLPQTLIDALQPSCTLTSKGEIGCFLSHVAAWERVAALGDSTAYALVAEDDAIFTFGPGVGLTAALEEAMARGLGYFSLSSHATVFAARRATSGEASVDLADVMAESIGRSPGLGAQGYLLTPAAAQALVEMVRAVGIILPLDWQMMAYLACLNGVLAPHIRWASGMEPMRQAIAQGRLAPPPRAGVSVHPIITPVDFGYQSINAE